MQKAISIFEYYIVIFKLIMVEFWKVCNALLWNDWIMQEEHYWSWIQLLTLDPNPNPNKLKEETNSIYKF